MATERTGGGRTAHGARLPRAAIWLLLGSLMIGPAAATAARAQPMWPRTSWKPVAPLDHPSLESRVAALDPGADSGFRFVVFGDQRALADGEWQDLIAHVRHLAARDERLLFMLDTGDIVHNGSHSDQFGRLKTILSPARSLPYLVGVGNHELDDNRSAVARTNTARFLSYLDCEFSPGRMYYRKQVGRVRFLFLDTTELLTGEGGYEDGAGGPRPGGRARAQMAWLARELADAGAGTSRTIVVAHHPFLQTSERHRSQAKRLWSYRHEGRTFPEMLLDGGVDLVLAGHTHTYEVFRLTRADGRELTLANVSGRPRNALLFFGASSRRARDIRGREREWLRDHGWRGIESWDVEQLALTGRDEEANQFAVVSVGEDAGLTIDARFLSERHPGGLRRAPTLRLR